MVDINLKAGIICTVLYIGISGKGASKMKSYLLRITVLYALAGLFLITGCAGTTVRSQLDNPGFQGENLPLRTLRVGVFSDGTNSQEEIVQLTDKTSSVLDRQLGIRLEAVFLQQIRLVEEECNIMLDRLHDSALNLTDNFDIAVAFVNPRLLSGFTVWKGAYR